MSKLRTSFSLQKKKKETVTLAFPQASFLTVFLSHENTKATFSNLSLRAFLRSACFRWIIYQIKCGHLTFLCENFEVKINPANLGRALRYIKIFLPQNVIGNILHGGHTVVPRCLLAPFCLVVTPLVCRLF